MGSLGSASIQLTLDRSQFDSDLQKLQSQDAGALTLSTKLNSKDFEQQIKALRIQSAIFIPLEIDTKTFDQQIKKLSTSIDPIKVDLAPNVKDFQEKLRRLSKITPVTVDIKVDEAKVRQQFETVGKYAAEGFTQGFSGVEGAGKTAIDSMVQSVKSQLGIQSPSKVFRDIGKYAAAGLMQGLDAIDPSRIQGRIDGVVSQFDRIKNYDFGRGNISDAITKPFKGIESIILAPFKGIESVILAPFKGIESIILAPFKGIRSAILAPFDAIKSIIKSVFSGLENISISVNSAQVAEQFRAIGRSAAQGFAQGFAEAEISGESVINSLVSAVRRQLGIQSPSKVFKEIGKFAIAGLMQGLDSVDESKLKGVTNKIEGYFKRSKIRVDVDINSGDFNPLKNISGAEASEKITDAIEEGFKRSRPKPPSTFSKIFSGIGGTLLAPLKGITTGAFEGVGLQLSKQLGTGLGRGIESQLAPIIGSFDLLGEKLITSAIPKLGNTVGGKIASAIIKSPPLQKLKQDLAGQITSIVGESEQLIASQSGVQKSKQRQQQQQKLSQRELGLQLQTAIANAPLRVQQAQQIKQEVLPQYQQEVKSKSSQLSSLQADKELLIAAGVETEEIKQAVEEIDLQIAQASSALVEAKKAEAFLQQQMSALLGETSSAVGKLKIAGANTSGVEEVESALKESAVKANGIVTRLDGNIKIQQENIKEVRVRLKGYKQEEARLKAEAIAALQTGDNAGAKNSLLESKKSGLRANAVQQEISAYKTNISENLKIKQESAGEFVQERKRLKDSLDQERAALAQRVVQKGSDAGALQEVQPQRRSWAKPEKAKQALITQVEDLVKQPAVVIAPPAPQIFQDVLAQFQQLSGIKIPANKIPQLVRGPEKAGFTGKYNSVDNAVTLPSGRYDELSKGVVSPDVIKTLVHELRHAMQTGFGQRTISQSGNTEFQLIKGTPQEQQQLGSKIQASADFFKKGALGATSGDVEVVRSLEEDAYVFAERYFEQVFKSIQQGLKSGIKSGGMPTEAELLKQVQATQATITANLKQSFKGPARDRRVTNPELAGSTLTNIDQQIALVGEQLKRTDLSGETRQKLGQFKGTIERQYRTYSPALRAKQAGSSSLGLSQTQGQGLSQGVELFEVSDVALRDFERQTRAAERRAKNVLKDIFKNSSRAAKRADKALEQLEQETNQQVGGIETGVAYDKAISDRRTRRTTRKIQRGYGGNIDAPTIETEAPRVEKDVPLLPRQSFFKGLDKEFRLARFTALTKQAEYLGQQAQILLADVDAQIALGKAQEKEAQLVQKQIQQNERRLNAVLSQIKRAQSGKDPKLTSGDIQRLSGQATELTGRIDADKQRLGDIAPNIKNGRELQPVAKNLRAGVALGTDASKQQNIKGLEKSNALIRENLKLLGEPPPTRNPFDVILGGADKIRQVLPNIFTLVKGFFAFSIGMWAQNFFGSVAQEAFKAYKELDRLKTSLNFASGGTAGGAQSLAFVRKTVDDLKIPLQASIQGFTQLAGATRNSALEGKQTKDLFQGLSEASTVLSLSAEDTSGSLEALSKAISQGRVGADLFDELGTRIPGVLGIAARAMGQTEEEFNRLRESGQMSLTPEDFVPRFNRQLHNEFGDAAKGASNNAPSTIYGAQNSFLKVQQSIGETVSPAAILGLNSLSAVLEGVVKVAKELAIIITAVSTVLVFKLGAALSEVMGKIILTRMAGATLGANFAQLGSILNNSGSVQWAVGISAVLEVVNLLNQAINTDLVKSFDEAAKAAIKAADASDAAFEKDKDGKPKQVETAPEASSGPGKFADDFLINPIRNNAQKLQSNPVASFLSNAVIPGGTATLDIASKVNTFGEYEKGSITKNTSDQVAANKKLMADSNLRLVQLQKRTGDSAQLPAIDAQLQTAEQQRQILKAEAKRNYTDKGKTVPFQLKLNQENQTKNISDLTEKRANISKPFLDDLKSINEAINFTKAQLESLSTPKAIAAVGGEKAADNLKSQYEESLVGLKKAKGRQEEILASFRVDPVRAFTQALRELNLVLAEGQEKNKGNLSQRKLSNTKAAIAGFSTNKLATKQLAFKNADEEYKSAQVDEANSALSVKTYEEAANKPNFQSTLQRLGVSPDASAAKIDDVLKNTSNEADKNILEQLKAGRESKTKFTEVKSATADAKIKRSQVVQDNSLFSIDESAANSRAATQKAENQKITAVKNAQAARLITEEVANEKISRIQFASTKSQEKNLSLQLRSLYTYHDQGAISAEKFAEKRRELETEQTNLEKQEAENRLGVQQAVIARRLKDIEFANKKAESAIALSQTTSTTGVKTRLLSSGITASTKDSADLDQNSIDQKAGVGNTALVKTKIAQNQQEYKEGRRTYRDFADQEMALNIELARSHQQLIDLKIAAEEKYRAIVERKISTNKTIAATGINKGLLASGLTSETQDKAALGKNKLDQQEATDRINFIKSRVKNEKDAKDEIAALESQLIDLKIAGEEKYRAIVDRNISTNKTIATTKIDKGLIASGLTPEAQDQAALGKNKLDQQEAVDRINFIKSRVKNEKDAKDEIAALDSQLTKLKIEGEEKYRENFEHSIQRVVQAEEDRFKKQQSQLDESKSKLELYNQSLDRTAKLEQSRNSLSKALSDATTSSAENTKTDADDDLTLVEKLKDKKTKGRTKRAILKQLDDRGYTRGTPENYELQIKEKKAATETAIALEKQASMAREQEFQRKTLENDLKRQKIAAQISLYEAQGYQLAAQKSKLEADAALKIAIIKKDPVAIETAKLGVELADKEIVLGDRRVESAQANLNNQGEIAANSIQEQKVTQSTENQNFQAGEKRRERSTALDLVETGEKARRPMSLTTAEDKAGRVNPTLAFPKSFESNPMPSLDLKPGENIFEGYQRQRERIKLPSASAKFPASTIADIPPMDKTTASVSSANIQPREGAGGNQFVEALKMANQGIEQRLDALRGAIMALANTPRSLTVSTANPVDDAADFMNRMSRGQVMAGGM